MFFLFQGFYNPGNQRGTSLLVFGPMTQPLLDPLCGHHSIMLGEYGVAPALRRHDVALAQPGVFLVDALLEGDQFPHALRWFF